MSQLPPAHHETSKRDSPNETKVKEKQNYPGFEFKPHQVNDSSQSNQVTIHLVSHVVNIILSTKREEQMLIVIDGSGGQEMKEHGGHVLCNWHWARRRLSGIINYKQRQQN
jgi:hypothetical protein